MTVPYNSEFSQLIGNEDAVMANRISALWNGSITGTGVAATLIPANASYYAYVKGLYLHLSMDATLATAGENTITVQAGAKIIFQDIVYIPAAAITVPEYKLILDDFEYITSAANVAITANISTALATGVLTAAVKGGYTALTLGD